MIKKFKGAAADAMKSVAGAFSSKKPKVTERRLSPVLQQGQRLLVVEVEKDEDSRLILPAKRRASSALVALFQGSKENPGPLPFFNRATNIVDLSGGYTNRRNPSFVAGHIEYDVVAFHLCKIVGMGKYSEQRAELRKHGFVLKPLRGHPFVVDIKRVLNII